MIVILQDQRANREPRVHPSQHDSTSPLDIADDPEPAGDRWQSVGTPRPEAVALERPVRNALGPDAPVFFLGEPLCVLQNADRTIVESGELARDEVDNLGISSKDTVVDPIRRSFVERPTVNYPVLRPTVKNYPSAYRPAAQRVLFVHDVCVDRQLRLHLEFREISVIVKDREVDDLVGDGKFFQPLQFVAEVGG